MGERENESGEAGGGVDKFSAARVFSARMPLASYSAIAAGAPMGASRRIQHVRRETRHKKIFPSPLFSTLHTHEPF
jgi:hypothetical protein